MRLRFDITLIAVIVVAVGGCSSGRTGPPLTPLAADYSQRPANGYHLLYSFKGGKDGSLPESGLTSVSGKLYGTTASGGDVACYTGNGCGTVFEVSANGTHSVLHRFTGYPYDGESPQAGLISVSGNLYGTTTQGGVSSFAGTVYKITPSGDESVVYTFKGLNDGQYPVAELLYSGGLLLGTTEYGGYHACYGSFACGTVFSTSLSGSEKVLHRFTGDNDGLWPLAGLTELSGHLYGTTEQGGAFKGAPNDGSYPGSRLIVFNGKLFGTTGGGGAHACTSSGTGCGTVFTIETSGKEKVLYSFAGGSDGAWPHAGLVNVNGTLYGTTRYGGNGKCPLVSGGPPGCGTIFSIAP